VPGDFWVINPRPPVLVFRLLVSDLPVIRAQPLGMVGSIEQRTNIYATPAST